MTVTNYMQLAGKILNIFPGAIVPVTDEYQVIKKPWTYSLVVEKVFSDTRTMKRIYIESDRRFPSSLAAKQAMREELAWQRKHHCCG